MPEWLKGADCKSAGVMSTVVRNHSDPLFEDVVTVLAVACHGDHIGQALLIGLMECLSI